MTGIHRFAYDVSETGRPLEGLALPLFLHSQHLATLDVYEDGVADCWELVSIPGGLEAKVERGSVTTGPPVGSRFSIHNLGSGIFEAVEWLVPRREIVVRAEAMLRQLNPTGQNLLDPEERRRQIAAKLEPSKYGFTMTRYRAARGVYRTGPQGRIAGTCAYVIAASPEGFALTNCFIYADQMVSMDYDTALISLDELGHLFETDQIRTSVDDGEWIQIADLGRFKAGSGHWYVRKEEVWKHIKDLARQVQGGASLRELCEEALALHLFERSDASLDHLRRAYEAMPRHLCTINYRDDEDYWDHEIKQILYGGPKPGSRS